MSESRADAGATGEMEDETDGVTDGDTDGVTGTEDSAIITATNVSRSFGAVDVLNDVSVSLEAGTVTTIIGPNGSGKTTLLRVLTRVLSPTSGSVTYEGPETAREIGYMPQQPAFRPGFTTRETLEFYTSLVDDEPAGLLERVGLGEAGERDVEALSGGMQRLLGIAQATVGDPPVVVLDEPGSGLDPGMRQRTFEVVRELADEGTAVVLSTHDLHLAEDFADDVILLEAGNVLTTGSPDALLETYECDSLQSVFDTAISRQRGTVEVVGESS